MNRYIVTSHDRDTMELNADKVIIEHGCLGFYEGSELIAAFTHYLYFQKEVKDA